MQSRRRAATAMHAGRQAVRKNNMLDELPQTFGLVFWTG
jgi:hypothetical protein